MNIEDLRMQFFEAITKTTLTFFDSTLEENFMQERMSAFRKYPNILVSFLVLLFLLLVRLIEFAIFNRIGIETMSVSASDPYINFASLCILLIVETVLSCVNYLNIFKGCPFMIGIFFAGARVSVMQHPSFPGFAPLTLLAFISALDVASKYTYNWITSCISCLIGFASTLFLIHYYTSYYLCKIDFLPIDELIFVDIVLGFSFTFLVMHAYTQERADRFTFFSYEKEKEVRLKTILQAHKQYKDFMLNIPNGIIILNENNEPLFWNNFISSLCPAQNFTTRYLTNSIQENLLSINVNDDGQRLTDFMKNIISEKGSLWELMSSINSDSQLIFSFKNEQQELKFQIQKKELQFNKHNCQALIFQDLSLYYEMAKMEEKYKRILLASIVHDIRTPIQGVLGLFEILEKPELSLEDREAIQIGRNTCKLLTFLTHDITDLGQMEAEKLEIRINPFDIKQTIYE